MAKAKDKRFTRFGAVAKPIFACSIWLLFTWHRVAEDGNIRKCFHLRPTGGRT